MQTIQPILIKFHTCSLRKFALYINECSRLNFLTTSQVNKIQKPDFFFFFQNRKQFRFNFRKT